VLIAILILILINILNCKIYSKTLSKNFSIMTFISEVIFLFSLSVYIRINMGFISIFT